MDFFRSQFRELAKKIAADIRHAEGVQGRHNITVIVEDAGTVENEVAEALSVAGICIIIGVTGFRRVSQSGPVIIGSVSLEFRVIERPSVNRNEQGFITTQQMTEWLITNLHWRTWEGMNGKPLLFQDFQRDDTDNCNISRVNFSGEYSLGMVIKEK